MVDQACSERKDRRISGFWILTPGALIPIRAIERIMFFSMNMVKLSPLFSVRHLLVLSLALNVSLMLPVIREKVKVEESLNVLSTKLQLATVLPSTEDRETTDNGEAIINLDHGDPTMYEKYWQRMGDKITVVISGWQFTSYFSDPMNLCWFLESELADEIVRLHRVVGNAITSGYHTVVGTGSSQLFQAALYALSSDATEPVSVVSAAPYYSSYPVITDCLRSGLYKWEGDAQTFDKAGPYIELVTSPNNPDGYVRQSVVNRSGGILVHDLAYYWPQYTPITAPADHDLMLFTVSKTTGHAGMRIGWALVKDEIVARKMVKYIELSTIGVSKDSQLRAAKVLRAVSDSSGLAHHFEGETFFGFSHRSMEMRWTLLREAVNKSQVFSLPDFTPEFCNYWSRVFEPLPAFAWLKCEDGIEDCETFLRGHKIWTRSGRYFGVSPSYVRISMLDRDRTFNLFVKRLSRIHLQHEECDTNT